jgi:spore coat polysaccharide biosynthesis protein SpsF
MKSVINIVTVIQARMNSSRLPYKVMMSLAGQPLLLRMVERVRYSKLSGCIVVATSTDASDDPIFNLCRNNNINVFRGHPLDLLDRHYRAGLKYDADVVVKIPSDCPLIDPAIITKVLKHYIENQGTFQFVSNLHPATYPDGNDVEAVSMEALTKAWKYARKNHEREHTTPYIWDNPGMFNIGNVTWETGWDYSMTHRWTIDYEDDYFFIKRIYDELYHLNPEFNMYDILALLDSKSELMHINSKYNGVNWYRNHLNDLNTINSSQTRFI